MNTWKSFLCFSWWDIWYSPHAKPLSPFLLFARIMSTLFILTVPTTRRTTGAHLRPRPCLSEPARCQAAARTPSVRGTSAAATTGASTPAWSLYSHRQVGRPRWPEIERSTKIVAVITVCIGSWVGGIVWVEDKALVPQFCFLGWLLNQSNYAKNFHQCKLQMTVLFLGLYVQEKKESQSELEAKQPSHVICAMGVEDGKQ